MQEIYIGTCNCIIDSINYIIDFIQILPICPLMSFFSPRIQSRILHFILLISVRDSYSFLPLTLLMIVGWILCKMSFNSSFVWFFLTNRLMTCIFDQKIIKVMLCPFQCIISEAGAWYQYVILLMVITWIIWLRWYLPNYG